jgi:hypothetical protein
MSRFRWRLARWFAPVPIISDPFPDEGGVVVMYSSPRDAEYRMTWAIRAGQFRMKSSHRLQSLDYGKDDYSYRPSRAYVRFVGTLGAPAPLSALAHRSTGG